MVSTSVVAVVVVAIVVDHGAASTRFALMLSLRLIPIVLLLQHAVSVSRIAIVQLAIAASLVVGSPPAKGPGPTRPAVASIGQGHLQLGVVQSLGFVVVASSVVVLLLVVVVVVKCWCGCWFCSDGIVVATPPPRLYLQGHGNHRGAHGCCGVIVIVDGDRCRGRSTHGTHNVHVHVHATVVGRERLRSHSRLHRPSSGYSTATARNSSGSIDVAVRGIHAHGGSNRCSGLLLLLLLLPIILADVFVVVVVVIAVAGVAAASTTTIVVVVGGGGRNQDKPSFLKGKRELWVVRVGVWFRLVRR